MTRRKIGPKLKPGPKPGTKYNNHKPRLKYMRVDLMTGEILEERLVLDPKVLVNRSECFGWLSEADFKAEFEPEPVEVVEELLRLSALLPPIPVEPVSPIGSGLNPRLLEEVEYDWYNCAQTARRRKGAANNVHHPTKLKF